ncbi:APA family basic amino acid/polyamine antiporter/amino acid efflux transporter [Clostridium pascui]|uniref:APC family permease n=1 Tax=Clostridium pascui TaxID=46609 RepID=UPI001958ECC9|nr:amino acid permease [Clostridium pascui]MBM7870708.1 APA family basic amino acid/polyamine antiporter/amino acid efflux transporter [Clostridium pascui]
MNLNRNLGFKEATALGIGAMVGAGIFVLSGVAAGKAGPAVIISFILAAILEILLGLCYAELASKYPKAGGSYEYVRETMGPLIGTLIGWAYWGAWLAASSFVSKGFGSYLNLLTGAPPTLSAIILLLILGIINVLGVKFSGVIQVAIVIVEIALLLSFFALGWSHVDSTLYTPFAPNGIKGILSAALVGFLSMVGWDGIVAAGEEIKDPKRTIPLAIFSSIGIVLLLYLGMLYISTGVVSWKELGASPVPVALSSKQFLGDFGPALVNIVIVITLPATANAFILSISRTAFAMGRNRLLPEKVAFIHPRFQTPIWAIALGVGIQILFTLFSSINIAVSATGFLYLITFIFTMIAFFISRRKASMMEIKEHFQAPFYPLTPILALGICIALLIPIGSSGLITGTIWLLIGIALYFIRYNAIKQPKQLSKITNWNTKKL